MPSRHYYHTSILIIFCFASLLFVTHCGIAAAEPVPPVPAGTFYVQDYANVLSGETKNKIQETSRALATQSKAQIVVVTVQTLDGKPIADYATELFRKWGIGDKQLNNGVLLLVAVKDRKSRIEVGYGLEGALPDGKTGRIQDEFMVPSFKKNDFNAGIMQGYQALVTEVTKEVKTASAEQAPAKSSGPPIWVWGVLGLLGIGVGYAIYANRKNGGAVSSSSSATESSEPASSPTPTSDDSDKGGGGSSGGGGSERNW
jgi:uncharacterized protein